jgi:hypothetical protein
MATDHRREVEVEALLHWTYRDELPQREISSAEGIWDQIAQHGQRGGIDVGHGAAQQYPHFGLPHPDALAIEKVVAALPDARIDRKRGGGTDHARLHGACRITARSPAAAGTGSARLWAPRRPTRVPRPALRRERRPKQRPMRVTEDISTLVKSANRVPEFNIRHIERVCGNCA